MSITATCSDSKRTMRPRRPVVENCHKISVNNAPDSIERLIGRRGYYNHAQYVRCPICYKPKRYLYRLSRHAADDLGDSEHFASGAAPGPISGPSNIACYKCLKLTYKSSNRSRKQRLNQTRHDRAVAKLQELAQQHSATHRLREWAKLNPDCSELERYLKSLEATCDIYYDVALTLCQREVYSDSRRTGRLKQLGKG